MPSANNSRSRHQNAATAEKLQPNGAARIVTAAIFAVFALIFGSLTITSFIRQSPSIDEPIHLLAGYSYVKWGDYRLNPEHPPLGKIWAALPLMGLNIADPRSSSRYWNQILETEPGGPAYPLAHEMFFVRNDANTLFFYAKIQMIALSLMLAAFIYRWTQELFGFRAAVVSLFLYGLDPNILAHSAMVHTDLPFAAMFFIATYFFWRALRNFTRPNLLWASLFFGLAAITKHSFVAIVPVWIISASAKIASVEPLPVSIVRSGVVSSRKGKALVAAGLLACAALAAYLSIWSVYGFRFDAVATGGFPLFMTEIVPPYKPIAGAIQSFVLEHRLFPEALISGYLYNLKIRQHPAYLLGAISEDGFWSYFPTAFAVKTPLPTVLLLAASVAMWGVHRKREPYLSLLLPPFAYFILGVLSRFNIGVRHLLPVYPFLFVLIGGAAEELWREGSRIKKAGLIFLGVWYLWSSFSTYPHYLAFFNELAGGPKNGHRVLLDSNLDWGQGLKELKRWMDGKEIKQIQLFYFGTADPKYYGIDDFYSTKNLASERYSRNHQLDLPDHLAVSANFRYGGELFLPKDLAALLRSYALAEPLATIGHSILIYKLDLHDGRVFQNAATLAARKGALDAAISLLQKAIEVNPGSAEARQSLGRALARRGRFDEAARHYEEALRLLRKSPSARNAEP
jgi:hypothetical protein